MIRNTIIFGCFLKEEHSKKLREHLFTGNELDFNKIVPNSNIAFCNETYFDDELVLAFFTENELEKDLIIKLIIKLKEILPNDITDELCYSKYFDNEFAEFYEYKKENGKDCLVLTDEFPLSIELD